MRRLRNWLAVALVIGLMPQSHAASVSVCAGSPDAVTPDSAYVTLTLNIAYANPDANDTWVQYTITCTGGLIYGIGNSWIGDFWDYSGSGNLPVDFMVYNITDDLVFSVTVAGGSAPGTWTIPFGKVTSVQARMHQIASDPQITEANYDQNVYFKAIYNTDPNPLPTGLTDDDVSWSGATLISGTPWALLSDQTPGHPTISAALGNLPQTKDVWRVKLTIQSTILSGTSFREIKRDPTSAVASTDVFGGTIPDPNNPTGPRIQLPHWTTGSTALPVLYQTNALVGVKPTFTFEPSDYSGPVHLQGSGTIAFSDAPDSHSAGHYLWQAQELTASVALPNDVGHDVHETAWQFYVGQSAPSDAGTSHYDIYRAISSSATDYITVVDIACNGVGGTDNATAFTGVWGKFQTRSVCKYGSGTMTYFYLGASAPNSFTKESLISSQDGKCGAWVDLFSSALEIHGIHPMVETIRPTIPIWFFNVYPMPPMLLYTGKALKFKSSLLGQGGTGIPDDLVFLDHVGVQLDGVGKIYDPSFGESYGTPTGTDAENYIAFEDGVVESQYCEMVDNGFLYYEFVPNLPGTRETKRQFLIVMP